MALRLRSAGQSDEEALRNRIKWSYETIIRGTLCRGKAVSMNLSDIGRNGQILRQL
jgi:hypothetical protein